MINFAKKNLFFIVIGVVAVLFLFVFNGKPEDDKAIEVKPIQAAADKSDPTPKVQETTNAYVDVKGEVNSPGVYETTAGTRVEDVIKLAGGFTKNANQVVINLAQKVHDEMIILVPKIGDPVVSGAEGSVSTEKKIRINYAPQEEMEKLNGIGPSKAQAIIQYREENGLFQTIEDLLEVSGIGEKTLENMKDSIQIP